MMISERKNENRLPAFGLLIFAAFFLFASFGSRETRTDPDTITVSGRIRLVGTSLFSSMVITDNEDQDWYVENGDREKLSQLQQSAVTVRGKPEYRELVYISGERAVIRYLRNIAILGQP